MTSLGRWNRIESKFLNFVSCIFNIESVNTHRSRHLQFVSGFRCFLLVLYTTYTHNFVTVVILFAQFHSTKYSKTISCIDKQFYPIFDSNIISFKNVSIVSFIHGSIRHYLNIESSKWIPVLVECKSAANVDMKIFASLVWNSLSNKI